MYLISSKRTQAGSVLLVSLMTSAIIGTTLASYLILTRQQHQFVVRSQTWNSAIVMSEAGVEDGLALLNKYVNQVDLLTNWNNSSSIAADNWTLQADGRYYVRRYLNANNYYDVYLTKTASGANIDSTGYAPWNYTGTSAGAGAYAAAGVSGGSAPALISRHVNVQTKVDALFNVAMAAIQQIDFNGKNVETDSFDSADASYSDFPLGWSYGLYPTSSAKQKANGDVATDYTITNSLTVGNAKIKGHASTGPKGTVTLGPNGSVGDKAWVEGGSTGAQAGHVSDDMNVLFPDVIQPSTTWSWAGGSSFTDISGIDYDVVINYSGDYWVSSFNKGVYVAPGVDARLLVLNNVNMNGSTDTIRISAGSRLKLYMYGNTFKVAGNGVINDGKNASAFYYFGLPTNKSVQFNGNADFTGAIYAPNADFTLGGGGSTAYDFVGASVSKTVKMNGHFKFHYDENLRRNGMGRGYIPTNWTES
ncbi:MAG: hypothetical protein EPO07_10460 [Verrucomicrobia bacterium]|nr:MAG: hypothetical protein EPO07_10460 [Verrucomicrobiota bacterium]